MMTREEAIALLNEQYETCKRIYDCSADQRKSYPNVPQFMEALDMALTALRPVRREQVEKLRGEWRPIRGLPEYYCSRCGEQFEIHSYDKDKYQFCPYCMSPMTDEAVEIVRKRMNALYGKENP